MSARPVLSPSSTTRVTGIGLRHPHYRDLLESRPALAFLEVHSENYFGDGGAPLHYLEQARTHYPVSLHGVGMSLGSSDPLSRVYLSRLKQLIDHIDPILVSDHLSWCSIDGVYLNDLLPLPYTEAMLDHVCARVNEAQDFLGRRMLIENPSSYLQFAASAIPEWEFLAEIARRTGCGILLDVNNIYVSGRNHGFSTDRYLAALPQDSVGEIHVAGHSIKQLPEGEFLIDTHGAPVSEPVWALYRAALARFGRCPTLVERDTNLPPLPELVAEAEHAEALALGVAHAA